MLAKEMAKSQKKKINLYNALSTDLNIFSFVKS